MNPLLLLNIILPFQIIASMKRGETALAYGIAGFLVLFNLIQSGMAAYYDDKEKRDDRSRREPQRRTL